MAQWNLFFINYVEKKNQQRLKEYARCYNKVLLFTAFRKGSRIFIAISTVIDIFLFNEFRELD